MISSAYVWMYFTAGYSSLVVWCAKLHYSRVRSACACGHCTALAPLCVSGYSCNHGVAS